MVRSSCPSRSGSASTSIATILPPRTVTARTANGLPSGAQATPPGIPFTRTRVAASANRRKLTACSATAWAPWTSEIDARTRHPPVGTHHDVRVEDRKEAFEIAVTRRSKERVDDGPLTLEIDVGDRRTLDAAAGPTCELSCRRRSSADDRCDLVERDGENIVEHERDPFCGCQRVEDDEERQADRVSQQDLLLGIETFARTHDRIR